MDQRCIGTLAERRDEAVGGQLLAGTGAGWFASERRLELFGVQLQILGETVDKQVAEPHGGEVLLEQRSHYSCWRIGKPPPISPSDWLL
ncbi:hypothetical protein D3C78_1611840 [compost metagenome]